MIYPERIEDGHIRTYRINEDRWKTLYEKWDEKEDVFAQVKIFPNTQIVHSVKVEEYLSQSAIDKLAMTNRLSDAWQDMQIQIDNQVYTLQEPLSSLTQSGWSIQQTEYEAQKRANLRSWKEPGTQSGKQKWNADACDGYQYNRSDNGNQSGNDHKDRGTSYEFRNAYDVSR